MNRLFPVLFVASAGLFQQVPAEAADNTSDQLLLPAQATTIDLKSGLVRKKGVSGQCVEKVSRAGSNTLVISKSPGDDTPLVSLNGAPRNIGMETGSGARLGTIQASRDGALFWLRQWKTGDKQTELLQDGRILRSWPAGSVVRLLRVTESELLLLVDERGTSPQLQTISRQELADGAPLASVLIDFEACVPERLRLGKTHVWAQLACEDERGAGIFRIPLDNGSIGHPDIRSNSSEFVALPKSPERTGKLAVASVSGSEAALQFYFAVKGLLLGQSGEVRACSSDAEGLQSWNQSYRLRSLATLYEKTGVQAFADLAVKSMKLTLAAQDGLQGRTGPNIPACGWSSKIYSSESGDRLSLMINQAVIANALTEGCQSLDQACPPELQAQISETASCLASSFEADFDERAGLYRIRDGLEFRFAGAVAPWNWQLSFAALLKGLSDKTLQARASTIVETFLLEIEQAPEGGLWRYWPKTYYLEKGLDPSAIQKQRFEDTGHAGISLMGLADMENVFGVPFTESVSERAAYLLDFGPETPRDLDGSGPRSPKWFPAGGWARVAPAALTTKYAGQVPGASAADTLFAYASLFDPEAGFDLTLDLQLCGEICQPYRSLSYDSWQAFLDNNPFFELRRAASPQPKPENGLSTQPKSANPNK